MDLVAEEVQLVDVREAVRAAGQVDVTEVREVDPIRVVREEDERLPEEEGHDGEVVADEPARRQADEQPEHGGRERDDGDRRLGLPVVVELGRGEDAVAVGAEADEGDVAEVEQPGVPDDDVEAEPHQPVQERVDGVTGHVLLRHHERKEGGRDDEHAELRDRRQKLPRPAGDACEPSPAPPALLVRGDPLVDADARRVGDVGRLREVHQTLRIAARPRRPLGRSRMTRIRNANT